MIIAVIIPGGIGVKLDHGIIGTEMRMKNISSGCELGSRDQQQIEYFRERKAAI